jgi:hypothetical protein
MSTPLTGKTLFGVSWWRVPGHRGRHVSWDGPGARVQLRTAGGRWADRPGMDQLGDDVGSVSEPCATLAEAQLAVDAYVRLLQQVTLQNMPRPVKYSGLPTKSVLRAIRRSKAQQLVDDGLADNLADARAQLRDMGE